MDGTIPNLRVSGRPQKLDFQVRLADLPPWFFWSREPINSTEEEIAAIQRGEVGEQRIQELMQAGRDARDRLAVMMVADFDEFKPHRLMVH